MMYFKNQKSTLLLALLMLTGFAASSQSYSVDIDMSPDQMIQNLVGPGVTISNVVVTACDSTYGYYTSSGTEIGTNQGLLLTTGKALFSVGPNNTIGNCSTSAGTCDYFDNDCPGSALLNQAQDRTTHDATMFEFDIVPQGDSLRFSYTFASEEYNEWVNSPFNDVFGFYITGPNVGTDVNIALIPNSSQVVAINTVNALSNSSYFYNNQNPLGQFIQYDGFTIGLAAQIGNLIPCETYHLKLVIADGTDHVYDSGVFINAIESNPVVVLTATSNGLDYMVEGCNTGTVTFAREVITDQPQDVLFWIGGSATNGVDYTPQIGSGIPNSENSITIPANAQSVSFDLEAVLDNIDEGQEYITVYLGNPLCSGSQVLDSINFFIYDILDVDITPDNPAICAGQCVELTGVSSVAEVGSFEWTGDVSEPQSLVVEVCPVVTTDYSLTVTVGSCTATDMVTVEVSSISLELEGSDINCEGGTTGSITVTVIDGIEPYSYLWTGPDGYSSTDAVPAGLAPGEYCVTVTDGAGCEASGCITLIQVNELTATSVLSDFNCSMVSCYGVCDGSIDITTEGGVEPFTFTWSGPDGFVSDSEDIANLCAGSYDLTITDDVGCEYTNSYVLLEPDSVELVVTGTTDLLCTGFETGEASVQASGGCSPYTYEWSHDASVTGPVAIELGSGTYEVSVQDQNGCSSAGSVTIVINDPIDPLNVSVDEISVYPGGFSISCPGATDGYINITVAGGSIPYNISWFSVSTNTVFSTAEDLADAPCGEYILTVTDANGCPFTQSLQLTCVPAITVAYDVTNNPCGSPEVGGGAIDVTDVQGGQGNPYTFEWNGPSCAPCSTDDISNLNSGDYVLTVSDALGCQTTITVNIGENDAFIATADVTQNSCFESCDGAIDITISGAQAAAALIVDASTEMSFCFDANHTFVSDLQFHLIGPPTCGSPDILLAANPGTNCNGGDNMVDLCFSTSSATNFNVCTEAVPLSGSFGTYGAAVNAIDWSPLFGCNASDPGWSVQIWDCVGGDSGTLLGASISFNGIDENGDPASIIYTSDPGFSDPINVTSCSGVDAATWTEETGAVGGGPTGTYTYTWSGPFNGPAPNTQDVSGLCAGTYTVVISSGDCEQTLTFEITQPEELVIETIAAINPTCFGQNNGSIDIEVTGGSGDYTYVWPPQFSCFFNGASSQDISNLFECSYSVAVTDNVSGCGAVGFFELDAPQVMDIVVVTSEFDGGYNISCAGANDGQISVFVIGGSPDCTAFAPYCYQYDWINDCSEIDPSQYGNDPNAPNATNLPGGTYGINVTDANGCLATTCLDLLEPDSISSPAFVENIDCNSETGCITPGLTGGSGLYIIYEWTGNIEGNDPSATTLCGLEAGLYTLTVTDSNNCQDTFEYEITEIPEMTAAVIETEGESCPGACDGTASIEVTGGGTSITPTVTDPELVTTILPVMTSTTLDLADLCSGSYSVSFEDENGCIATVDFVIDEPEQIVVSLQSIIQEEGQIFDIQCFGDSTGQVDGTISGGVEPYTIIWSNELLEVIGTEEDIDSLSAGTYCMSVTDQNGCFVEECITITQPDLPLEASGVVSVYNVDYNVSCFGATDGSIDITVTGGVGPYVFNWNGDGTIETDEDQINLGAGIYDVLIQDANFCTVTLTFELLEPTPIVADATFSLFDGGYNISCNGECDGSIDLDISGGSPDYIIVWSGPNDFASSDEDIADLCAGTYNVTITDDLGCSISQSYVISQPEVLEAEIVQTLNCLTGNVDLCVTVSGGSGSYNYDWSEGSTSACIVATQSGEFCVTITDSNGCTVEVCVDTEVSEPLDVSGVVVNTSCGLCIGSIDMTISGGLAPYDFTWSGGQQGQDLTSLCAGTYTIVVTDANECEVTQTFIIEDTPGVALQISQQNVVCNGGATGSASATTVGGTPEFIFSWTDSDGVEFSTSSSVQGLTAGVYNVSVSDGNGCFDSEQVTIVEPAALVIFDVEVSVFGNYNISAPGGSDGAIDIEVIGGTPEYSYVWLPEGTGSTDGVSGLSAGDYTVTVTDANGCTVDSTITLVAPREFKLYTALSPNGDGFNDFYVIDGIEFCTSNTFKVFNRWGNVVYEKTNYRNEWYGQDDDNGTLADGTYFVIFEGCSKEVSTYVDLRRE